MSENIKVDFFIRAESWEISLVVLIGMIIFIILGKKIGERSGYKKLEYDDSIVSMGIYTLMAFILAFTFTMAGTRYDSRKKIIIDEANAIGTAVMRSNLYPDSIKTEYMNDFSIYLESRIKFVEARDDVNKIKESLKETELYGDKLFSRAAILSKNPEFLVASNQMIPALNEMLDIANSRFHEELYKVPIPIIFMLFSLLLITAFIYGYSCSVKGKKLNWHFAISYCIITMIVIYLMLDFDRPRRGIITLDESNNAIIALRSMFAK